MIHKIEDRTDKLAELVKDDPVRKHIPLEQRLGFNKDMLVLMNGETPEAVVCVSCQNYVPTDEEGLTNFTGDIAVFYTIWSYVRGAGHRMLFGAKEYIEQTRPYVKRFVTLSPKTEMAEKFHLRNGATVFRVNDNTVNYEYGESK